MYICGLVSTLSVSRLWCVHTQDEMEANGGAISRVFSMVACKTMKNLNQVGRRPGVPAEILTDHLLNICLELYCYTKELGDVV